MQLYGIFKGIATGYLEDETQKWKVPAADIINPKSLMRQARSVSLD